MRDFKGMKRQRNRGRGGGGGGKPQPHNANRAFDSNGPDGVKVRGAAQHIYEKYQQLARDASSASDRVLAENYLQHAEHYFRVLRAMQPQRPVTEIIGRDQFVSGYDIDFEDEAQNAEEAAEAEADGGQERQGGERPWQRDQRDDRGEYRQRDDRPRDDREFRGRDGPREERGPRDDRGEYRQRDDRGQDRNQGDYRPREDRPRDDRPRDDRPREDRQTGELRQRDDRPRDDRRDERPRDDRPQGRDRYPREDRQGRSQGERQPDRQTERPAERQSGRDFRGESPERDPLTVIEPRATPLTAPQPTTYEPREGERVLRGEDGATSHAPAFLQSARSEPRAEPGVGGEEAAAETRRPRRRRAPRTFEAGDAPAAAEADEG
jgi:hypothetical protein